MQHDRSAFGVWLVDKPAGPTSHDVVAGIRRRLGRTVKVGHAGTLDPFATGLLVVVVGRATRLVPYLTGLDKTYVARIRLGATSASGDTEGPITVTGVPVPGRAQIDAAVARARRDAAPAGPGARRRQGRRGGALRPNPARRDRRGAGAGDHDPRRAHRRCGPRRRDR